MSRKGGVVGLKEVVTTLLDALGLLLVAAGAAAAAWWWVGPASLGVAGLVVLAGSWWAADGEFMVAARRAARRVDAERVEVR